MLPGAPREPHQGCPPDAVIHSHDGGGFLQRAWALTTNRANFGSFKQGRLCRQLPISAPGSSALVDTRKATTHSPPSWTVQEAASSERVLVDSCEGWPSKGHAAGHVAGLPRKSSWQGRGAVRGCIITVHTCFWAESDSGTRRRCFCSAAVLLQGGRDGPCQICALQRNNDKRCRHRCKPGK